MPLTANEVLRDEAVGHRVDLTRYSAAVARRIVAVLNSADRALMAALLEALDRVAGPSFTVERLDAMLASALQVNRSAYERLGMELTSEMRALVEYEAQHAEQTLRSVLPEQLRLRVATITGEQAWAAANARPFQGRLLSEWARSLEASRATRLRDYLRTAFVSNMTVPQMAQGIRGTREQGYTDGILNVDRRHAEAVARTAAGHFSGAARDRFYGDNSDLIAGKVWVSTLDLRTTPLCQVRDGKEYTNDNRPVGHRIPWLAGPGRIHWNCRSTSHPLLKGLAAIVGAKNVGAFTPAERASMDGAVPAETTYGDWLRRQSAARQDDVLGPTRGAMLRSGEASFDRFTDDRGRLLTLDQLRARL